MEGEKRRKEDGTRQRGFGGFLWGPFVIARQGLVCSSVVEEQ